MIKFADRITVAIVVAVIGYLIFRIIAAETLSSGGELKLIKRVTVLNKGYKIGVYHVPSDATIQGGISVYFERKANMEEFAGFYPRYRSLVSVSFINDAQYRICLEDNRKIDTFYIKTPANYLQDSLKDRKNIHDTIGKYYGSEGVVNFGSDNYLKNGFELLNEDSSVYMLVKPYGNNVMINNKEYDLDQFLNNDSLRASLQFQPYMFYPDNSVFIFEYVLSGIVKHVKQNKAHSTVTPWSKHLIGAMVLWVSGRRSCADVCGIPCKGGKNAGGWINGGPGVKY